MENRSQRGEGMSEFGTGFIYCLINFAKHFDKAYEFMKDYTQINLTEEQALSNWISGASDHLYNLKLPKNLPTKIKQEIDELQSLALEWGHGNKMMRGMPERIYKDLRNRLNNIALMIDKWLKVKTEKAGWD